MEHRRESFDQARVSFVDSAKKFLPGLVAALGLFGVAPEARAEQVEAGEKIDLHESSEISPVEGAEHLTDIIDPENGDALRTRAEACVDAYYRAKSVVQFGKKAVGGDYVFVVKTVGGNLGKHNENLHLGVQELRECFRKDARTSWGDRPGLLQLIVEGDREGVTMYPSDGTVVTEILEGIQDVRVHVGTVREISLGKMMESEAYTFNGVREALNDADGFALGFTLEQNTPSSHVNVFYDGSVRVWKGDEKARAISYAGMLGSQFVLDAQRDRGVALGMAVELGNPNARVVGGPFIATSLGESKLGDLQVVMQLNFRDKGFAEGFAGGTAALRVSKSAFPKNKK